MPPPAAGECPRLLPLTLTLSAGDDVLMSSMRDGDDVLMSSMRGVPPVASGSLSFHYTLHHLKYNISSFEIQYKFMMFNRSNLLPPAMQSFERSINRRRHVYTIEQPDEINNVHTTHINKSRDSIQVWELM